MPGGTLAPPMRQRWGSLVGPITLMALVWLGAAGFAFPSGLSRYQAIQITIGYYQRNIEANASLNVAIQETNEEGISAAMDTAVYALLKAEGKTQESAFTVPATGNISVYLPATGSSPDFYAVIRMPKSNNYALNIFQKDSASARWRVVYELLNRDRPAPPKTSRGHIDIAAGSVVATSWMEALSNYFNSHRMARSHRFAKGAATSGVVSQVVSEARHYAADGIQVNRAFAPYRTPAISIPTSAGVLVFGGIYESAEIAPTLAISGSGSSQCVFQKTGPFATLLGAGQRYGQINEQSALQVVLFVPTGRNPVAEMLGAYGFAPLGATGTPCGGAG